MCQTSTLRSRVSQNASVLPRGFFACSFLIAEKPGIRRDVFKFKSCDMLSRQGSRDIGGEHPEVAVKQTNRRLKSEDGIYNPILYLSSQVRPRDATYFEIWTPEIKHHTRFHVTLVIKLSSLSTMQNKEIDGPLKNKKFKTIPRFLSCPRLFPPRALEAVRIVKSWHI